MRYYKKSAIWIHLPLSVYLVVIPAINICCAAVYVWCDHQPRWMLQAAHDTWSSTSAAVGRITCCRSRIWKFPVTIPSTRCTIHWQLAATVGKSRADFPHEWSSGRPWWRRQTTSDIFHMNVACCVFFPLLIPVIFAYLLWRFFPSVFSVYTDLECCGKSGNWGGCSKSGNFVGGHGKMTCHPSMTLAIKCIRNLPPHLSYVSTLPHITQKWKSYLPLSSVSGSGKNRFWCVRSGCFHHFCGKIK